jgi:hypothetical protein
MTRFAVSAAAMAVGALFAGAAAHASQVPLSLNYYETAASGGSVTTQTASNMLDVPGSYNYGNPTLAAVGADTQLGTTGEGFYDDFVFTIVGASADSVTSTISLPGPLGTQEIDNLNERIYSAAGFYSTAGVPIGSSTLPVLGSVAGEIDSTTILSGSQATVVEIAPTVLAPGTYVLEIRGLTSNAGGSYAGTLALNPVPLPAALPLILSGLGALRLLRRPRGLRPALG